MYELTFSRDGDRLDFVARQGDTVLAELTAVLYEGDAVLHNEIHEWRRRLIPVYRAMFKDVRGVLQVIGVRLVIPCSAKHDEKMGKFWRLMGFDCSGEIQHEGTTVHFAVMEA